jgi:hypothetical protein
MSSLKKSALVLPPFRVDHTGGDQGRLLLCMRRLSDISSCTAIICTMGTRRPEGYVSASGAGVNSSADVGGSLQVDDARVTVELTFLVLNVKTYPYRVLP